MRSGSVKAEQRSARFNDQFFFRIRWWSALSACFCPGGCADRSDIDADRTARKGSDVMRIQVLLRANAYRSHSTGEAPGSG